MKITHLFIILSAFTIISISCSKSDANNENSNSSSPGKSASVTWHNFNEGIKLAKKTKRPVVIDFYADWCGWCKTMEKKIFSDNEVAKKLKDHFICIRIHMDRQENEIIEFKNHTLTKRELSMMLGVQGLPTAIFMDKDGNLITRIPGFIKKNIFLALLGYMKDECYLQKIPFSEYMTGNSDCGKGR